MNTIESSAPGNSHIEQAISNCESEAIHQVGQIQPIGVFLALDDDGLRILHVSRNCTSLFPYSPEALLGLPFSLLVGAAQAESIRQVVGLDDWRRSAITSFHIERGQHSLTLDAQISRSAGLWMVEIELQQRDDGDLFHQLFIPIRDALWQLDAEENLRLYTGKVVEQVRLLTGYDRVMMYQFDDNWDGEVIAESKSDDVESYLGNRFPAGDIPAQARSLYTKNLIRLIADIDAVPVDIVPGLQTHSGLPLDMTYSALRALSPVHIEYLRNMGVHASLSISLIQNDKLWGLIACHHTTPKFIPMRSRELDEFIGKTVSVKLSNLGHKNKTHFHDRIRSLLEKLTQNIRIHREILPVIAMFDKELLALVQADGAIIKINDNLYHLGETPTDKQESEIDNWLKTLPPKEVFQTENLTGINPTLKVYQDVACGLMVAPLDHRMDNYIAWFRSPIVKTIKWAGKPEKIINNQQGKLTISPRASFASWVETFQDRALPWTQMEIDAAYALSLAIIEVLNHHALEQSEANYRFLAENSSDMIARFDRNGVYTFVSPACEHLFGYTPEQMVGHPVIEFIVENDREHCQNALDLLGQPHEIDTVIFRPLHRTGKILWLEYTLRRIQHGNHEKVEIVANGRDVTQRHTYQLAMEDLHRRNALMLEASGDGLIGFDQQGRIVYSNEKVRQILGWESRELSGQPCVQLFYADALAPQSAADAASALLASIRSDIGCSAPCACFRHKDGHGVQVEYTCTPLKENEHFNGAVLVFHASSAQWEKSEQALAQDTIINEAVEAVMVTDAQRCLVSVNRAFTDITGYSPDEAIGQTPRFLKSGVHTPNFYAAMYASLREKNYWAGEIWNRRKNGEIYPQWGSITAILDENNQLKSYVGVFSDISKAKQAEEHLYYLANHDPLTGLANRSKFVDYLNHALERARRAGNEKIAVAFIDLDRFKIINDTLGHAIGDQYLKAIAIRIASVCRSHDLLSRWGGDEFVLAMDNIQNQETVTEVVRRIIQEVHQPLAIDEHELEPTMSIGISLFPEDADNTTDLVKAADTAMYRVKSSGRNNFKFFAGNQAQENKKKFEIVSELNRALRLNEFVLYYQPQIEIASGDMVGMEALVRWLHPLHGFLPPDNFIPLIEELGLIAKLGEWVINAACKQMSAWRMQGVDFPPIAVNISPSELTPALVEFVTRTLTSFQLPASLLELEITESTLGKGGAALPILKQFREMGVSLSIDDFGTGYSSLSHLKYFPINCFKIDKSFIDGLPGDVQDVAIVKTILALGANLAISVVVEGVETLEQRDFLASIGAKIIQGYFYAKPLESAAMTQRLHHH